MSVIIMSMSGLDELDEASETMTPLLMVEPGSGLEKTREQTAQKIRFGGGSSEKELVVIKD